MAHFCYQFLSDQSINAHVDDLLTAHNAFTLMTSEHGCALYTQESRVLLAELAQQADIYEQDFPKPVSETHRLVMFGRQLTLHDVVQLSQLLHEAGESIATLTLKHVDAALPAGIVLQFQADADTEALTQQLKQFAQTHAVYIHFDQQQAFPTLAEPGVLVMDMDSTAIQIECIDEMARLHNVYDQISEITATAMKGGLDFSESLRTRVAILGGADASIIDKVLATLPLMPGLEALVSTLKNANWHVAIASGGFLPFTEYLRETLDLHSSYANSLVIKDGKLTGEVEGDIVDADYKAHVVTQLAKNEAIPTSQTIAIGDGANDLVMMAAAGLGVAFHAKPLVQEKAQAAINEGSLMQLLFLLKE